MTNRSGFPKGKFWHSWQPLSSKEIQGLYLQNQKRVCCVNLSYRYRISYSIYSIYLCEIGKEFLGQTLNKFCSIANRLCSDVTWIYFLTTRDILDPIWKPWDLKFYFFLFAISGHHLEQEFLTVYADAMARCFSEQIFPRIFLSLTKRGG